MQTTHTYPNMIFSGDLPVEPLVQDNLLVGHSHNAVDREHAARVRALLSVEYYHNRVGGYDYRFDFGDTSPIDFNGARLGRPLYSAERRAYTVPSSRYTLIRSLRRPQRELVPCQQCQALRAQEID